MDQIGAFLGPALFSLLLFSGPDGAALADYRRGLLLLFIPAGLVVLFVVTARFLFPRPQSFELEKATPEVRLKGFSRQYWMIVAASGLLAVGITDFPLIGLHLIKTGGFTEAAIPLLYSGAMAVDAAAALVFGRLYDRYGARALLGLFIAELFTAPLVFLGPSWAIIVGMALWGVSVGTQESILKAAIGDRVPKEKRARAYGLFNTAFGFFWFVGSAIIGLLYDRFGPVPMVVFSVVFQGAALVVFASFNRHEAGERTE